MGYRPAALCIWGSLALCVVGLCVGPAQAQSQSQAQINPIFANRLKAAAAALAGDRYAEALADYQSLFDQATKAQDAAFADLAQGGLGLTHAAIGDNRKALDLLNDSAAQARSDGLAEIAGKSQYNAALVSARLSNVPASNLLWLNQLRGKPITRDYGTQTQATYKAAVTAFTTAGPALAASVGVKARVLAVNYAYSLIDDDRATALLDKALDLAVGAKSFDGQLAVADAAIGRYALYPEARYSQMATQILQGILAGKPEPVVEAQAMGLLGRLYGLQRYTSEAISLTGEANLLATKIDNVSLELEFGTQYAALLESANQKGYALMAYDRVAILIEAMQPVLSAQTNIEQRADLRQLMSQALLAQVEDILDVSGNDPASLRRARDLLELEKVIDFEAYFDEPCIQSWVRSRKDLDQIDPGTAVIYPVVFDDHVVVIVATSKAISAFTTPVGAAEVAADSDTLRQQLSDPQSTGYLAPARALYDVLLRPEARMLQDAQVKTLVFAPNETLRGVPLAALNDGTDYVVSHYAVGTAIALSLVDTTAMDHAHPVALIAGLSQARQGMPALPNVVAETGAIGKLLGGDILLDGQFTRANLARQAARQQPTLLHIAGHGHFSRLREDNFILSYDTKLTDVDLKGVIASIDAGHGLDLVTLSACETAAGDPDALLGLAGVAYQSGARTVVGSLWEVSDASTETLMTNFYTGLVTRRLSRAEALRQAQLSLIASHPYYWSPFLIVGNWQ